MMPVQHVEIFVEEPSMEAALRILLPRALEPLTFEIYRHQCKDELLLRLPDRLRGYSGWLPEDWHILVVVDRDADNCLELKRRLEEIAVQADLGTRRRPVRGHFSVTNRIAIEELEASYFGDWEAVRTAYPRVSGNIPRQIGYRDPDSITGGTWEALERILRRAGYFTGGFRKIEAARTIAPHMVAERNGSHSYQVLWNTLLDLRNTDQAG